MENWDRESPSWPAGRMNVGSHSLLTLIAEFDQRKAWSGDGTVRSCAHWLNWQCGIALGAAREKVRVAGCLQRLPLIDASFVRGETSYSKARAMTRVATPGSERKLIYFQDRDDMWVIHANLPPEAGALVVKATKTLAAPAQVEKQQQLQDPQKDVYPRRLRRMLYELQRRRWMPKPVSRTGMVRTVIMGWRLRRCYEVIALGVCEEVLGGYDLRGRWKITALLE